MKATGIMAAREAIKDLVERNNHYAEDYEEAIEETAKHMAGRIARGANVEDQMRMAGNAIADYRRDADKRRAIADALQLALDIVDAATGNNAYALRDGYYGATVYKFAPRLEETSDDARETWLKKEINSSAQAITGEQALEAIAKGARIVEVEEEA